MGDCVDARVSDYKTGYDNTDVSLVFGQNFRATMKLPLPVHFKRGDRIEFLQGCLGNPVQHDNYIRATVYRGGEPFLSWNARDMRILQEVREAEKTFRIEESALDAVAVGDSTDAE